MVKVNPQAPPATGSVPQPKQAKQNAPAMQFKDVMELTLQGDAKLPTTPATPGKTGQAETEKQEPATEQPETKPADDIIAAALAAGAAPPVQQPASQRVQATAESTKAEPAAQVAAPVQAVSVMQTATAETAVAMPVQAAPAGQRQDTPATPELSEQAAQQGDILAAEATVPETRIPPEQAQATAPQIPAAAQNQPESQNRLSTMLNQAQQELQAIAMPRPEEIPADVVQDTLPPEQPEEPPVAENQQPVADEAPEAEQAKAQPQASATRTQTQPSTTLMDQRPLRALPKEDRAVMEMQVPAQKPVTAEAETKIEAETAKVEAIGQEARPQETRQLQPQQPLTGGARTDQAEQVRLQMAENMERGRLEFRMQLQPENLGKVDVKMVLESGRLAVEIMAATPKAAELLGRQAESLAQSLRMQNIDVQSIQVVTESEASSSQMGGAFNMLNGQAQGFEQQGTASGHGFAAHGTQGDLPVDEADIQTTAAPNALLDTAV